MKKNLPSRRKFLKIGITAGAGALLVGGSKMLSAFTETEPKETGEKVKVLSADGKLMDVDKGHLCCAPVSNKEAREGIPDKKMVMVIDLAKCRNARKCLAGCQSMHMLPPHMDWIKFYLMRDTE